MIWMGKSNCHIWVKMLILHSYSASGTRQSTEVKPDIPRYTDVYLEKSNPTVNEKVYSLRDSSRNEDLASLRASRSTVRPTENGNGSNLASGLVQVQSTAGRHDRSEIQPTQLDLSLPAKTLNWQTVTFETPKQPTVSLPGKSTNWQGATYETNSQPIVSLPGKTPDWQGMTYETQNSAVLTQTASSTVVTSASNFSVERQAVTSPPMTAPLSAGFQPTLMSTPVAFPPNVTLATPSFPSSMVTTEVQKQQQQQPSAEMQQLQTLLQQIQQTQQLETKAMADHGRQQVILQKQAEVQQQAILQKQAEEISQREKQVQAREQMLQQRMQQIVTEQQSQQQLYQPQQPQQQQQQQQQVQIQQTVADSKPQVDQTAALKEKRLKHEVLSAYFEKEAQKMNPGFKLLPSQMFLLLGDKITIADRSLVDIVFPSAGPQTSLNVDSLLQTLANQSAASPLGGASIYTQPVQSANVVSQSATVASQYGSPNQAFAYQAPQVAQQLSLPQLQNMSAQLTGNFNPFEVTASVPSQQYSTGIPQVLAGNRAGVSSVGNQQLSTLGLGTGTPQSSGQSGRSIFPRNNLPFSAANLDDDDVEVDSEGPKRKNPIQLYGKTAKKLANGSNMKNGLNINNGLNMKNGLHMKNSVSLQEGPVVIDLTMDTKNNIDKLNTDLNDDNDLETDYLELNMDKQKANDKIVEDYRQIDKLSKIEKSKKLSGLHVGGKVRVVDDNEEVTQADDSGVFSMEEKET